jgi:hypothetical protein
VRAARGLHDRTDVAAWLNTPLLPQGDPARPTFRIALFTSRAATHPDSGMIIFTDVTDSVRYDLGGDQSIAPALVTGDGAGLPAR